MVGMNVITDRDRTKNTHKHVHPRPLRHSAKRMQNKAARRPRILRMHIERSTTRIRALVIKWWDLPVGTGKNRSTPRLSNCSRPRLSGRSDRTEPSSSQPILPGHLSGEQLKRHAATQSPCTKLTKRSPTEKETRQTKFENGNTHLETQHTQVASQSGSWQLGCTKRQSQDTKSYQGSVENAPRTRKRDQHGRRWERNTKTCPARPSLIESSHRKTAEHVNGARAQSW